MAQIASPVIQHGVGAIFISCLSVCCDITEPVQLCIEQVIVYTFAIYDHLTV
jgi:hypothetical protein